MELTYAETVAESIINGNLKSAKFDIATMSSVNVIDTAFAYSYMAGIDLFDALNRIRDLVTA